MKRIAILTSGGDAPGMNAAIRAVVRSALYKGWTVYGIDGGYQGLIEARLEELTLSSVADIVHRGGTILGTSRSEEFQRSEGRKKALTVLKIYEIDALVVLGGDGSFRGAATLQKEGIAVIGIPCTIDNDLGYTAYTIGFFTAVATATEAISKIRDTTSSHGRANVVEVMGRSCGDLALYAGLAGGAENIIIPEKDFSMEELAKKALEGKKRGKRHHIIVLAEGVGKPYEVARKLEELTGIDTKVTILGYIQRGGAPNVLDRIIATNMGFEAVERLEKGESGLALGYKDEEVFGMDLLEAVSVEKEFNQRLYDILKVVSI